MKLHPLYHDPAVPRSRRKTTWCGPATVTAITGVSIEAATAWFQSLRGTDSRGRKIGIKSVTGSELEIVLTLLGYWTEKMLIRSPGYVQNKVGVKARETVAAFLRRRTAAERKVPIILSASRHLNVVFGSVAIDNVKGREIIGVSDISRRRGRLRRAYQVSYLDAPRGQAVRALLDQGVQPYPERFELDRAASAGPEELRL